MRCARILQQTRGYWMQYAASIAATLLAASACAAQSKMATRPNQQREMPLAQELSKYPGLLPELGQLLGKLQSNVQFPEGRGESRLLPMLPASTIIFAAFPNYGDAAHQALRVFHQELEDSAVLRDWWNHGEMATGGPKIEDFLEKFDQLHQYLGDEIVLSGAMQGRVPKFLVVAEVRKPGLKKFLEQIVDQLGNETKAGVRVLDPQGLANAKDKGPAQELTLFVRPDFVVAGEDLPTLRNFNAGLDQRSREFRSTPFGQRVAQEYEGGVTTLAAADLHRILNEVPPGTSPNRTFQRSGFADMKYLIWEHKDVGAQSVSQAELSFSGPRRGLASWLAKPAPLGSLDFVSPKALFTASVVLTSLPQIFDDVKELAGPANSDPFTAIASGEKALNLSLKDDLLSQLAGELAVELDSITPPQPVWKAIFKVKDARHLQQTLSTFLAATQFQTEHVDEAGGAYYTVRVPSQTTSKEIAYAFVDGYLIAASSSEVLADAVRLHGSGGSLAKSEKFLVSLPPGHSSDASALLFQNSMAMGALSLRQVSPRFENPFAQFLKDAPPTVICLYGEESAIREASSSGPFDVGAMLVVAAIAIPNLVRSKMAANEASAVGSVRTVNTAQVAYTAMYPQKGFAPHLAALGLNPRSPNAYSPEHAGLLDETLGNESCTGDAWCTRYGFHFRVTAVCKQRMCTDYVVVATPVASNTGTKSFCSTSDAVIRSKTGASLTSPVSISECKTWPPLQ
jgi:hypothetical protein